MVKRKNLLDYQLQPNRIEVITMRRVHVSQILTLFVLISLFLSVLSIMQPAFPHETNNTSKSLPSSITTPGTINGKIVYPRQHIPAIILNGSQVELQIKAPDNITSWEISLNREYRAYTLSHDPPVYNISANLWRLNVTIASSTIRDLYDLNVTISDGLNSQVLIEWNAVQVRYEYPTNPLIYHLSDVHIGQGLQDQTRSILSSLYQAAMAEADLIIITGDITDTGFSTHFLEFKNLFRNSRVPIIVSAGNHDRDFSDTYSVYISHFGADYYTFNLGPDIFIVMANSHHSPYEYNATQIGWVERDFAASDAKLKIMAGHAPLMNPEFFTYWLVQWEREELQRIFDTYNVSVYLSGHFHGDLVNIINDTYWIQTAPCGGNPRMYDPYGHKTRGLRALNFTNYALTSWSWMDLNWSQSIDALYLSRDPLRLIDADIGGYLSITNTLGYTARNLMVDILVEPLTGPEVYRASGATVLETVNGTNTWLIRFSLDIPNGETGVIRVYTSNAQAPVITAVEYPPSAPLQTLVFIYANVSNPYSGIHFVSINLSIAGNPYFQPVMSQAGFERYRYYLPVTLPGVYNFAITAFDYAGYNITTSFYSFTVTQQAPSAPVLLPLNAVSETGNFTVIWTQSIDSDGSIDHYTLQMSNSIDFSVVLDEQNISALNYAVLGLVNGSYYFRVCGVDNFGAHSSWSNVESISVEIPGVTPPPPPPPPPPPIPIELVIAIVGGVAVVVIVIIVVYALIRRGRGKTQ